MEGQYNLRSPAVKRLMKEAQELREPTEQFYAQPLEDNLFEWHFTIRGPADCEFDGGIYHGRIILPPEYPMKPPSIILLTPNGRFETHKKICLSISGFHPESWQPSWSLRTALLAIIGFMPTHGNGAIGSLDYTPEERKMLAKKSVEWKCEQCGCVKSLVLPVTEASQALNQEAKELGSQISLQGEKEKPATTSDDGAAAAAAAPTTATTSSDTTTTSPPPPTFPNLFGSPFMFPPADPNSRFPPPSYSSVQSAMAQNPAGMPPFMSSPAGMVPGMPPFMSSPAGMVPGMPPFNAFMPSPYMLRPGQMPPFMPPTMMPFYGGMPPMGYWPGMSAMPGRPRMAGTPPFSSPFVGFAASTTSVETPIASTSVAATGVSQPTAHTAAGVTTLPRTTSTSTQQTVSTATSAASTTPTTTSQSTTWSLPRPRTSPTSPASVPVAVSSPAAVASPTAATPATTPAATTPAATTPAATTPAAAPSPPTPAAVPTAAAAAVPTPAAVDDDPVLSANELRRRRTHVPATHVMHPANQSAELPARAATGSRRAAGWLSNLVLAVLILCIVVLLARRLYLLAVRY